MQICNDGNFSDITMQTKMTKRILRSLCGFILGAVTGLRVGIKIFDGSAGTLYLAFFLGIVSFIGIFWGWPESDE